MSEYVGATELEIAICKSVQSEEEQRSKAEKLPDWVKCMYCGCRPSYGNLLGEVVRHSSALACQNCMKARGKIFGLNVGETQLDLINSKGEQHAPLTHSS